MNIKISVYFSSKEVFYRAWVLFLSLLAFKDWSHTQSHKHTHTHTKTHTQKKTHTHSHTYSNVVRTQVCAHTLLNVEIFVRTFFKWLELGKY